MIKKKDWEILHTEIPLPQRQRGAELRGWLAVLRGWWKDTGAEVRSFRRHVCAGGAKIPVTVIVVRRVRK